MPGLLLAGFDSLKFDMDHAVSLRSAVVLLGRFPALSGADLSVERGEIVAVRGANGAGKTTLLRLCAGLVRLYQGEGTVLGSDLAGTRADGAWRSRVGFLGHETRLYGDLTAKENVEFARALCGLGRRAGREVGAEAAAEAALEQLELPARLHCERVSRLSAGQQRRVAFACVMVRRPELWLLDEPHASLDAEGRKCIDAIISEVASAGAAVIVVTHEQGGVFGGGSGEAGSESDLAGTQAPSLPAFANLRTVALAGGRVIERSSHAHRTSLDNGFVSKAEAKEAETKEAEAKEAEVKEAEAKGAARC